MSNYDINVTIYVVMQTATQSIPADVPVYAFWREDHANQYIEAQPNPSRYHIDTWFPLGILEFEEILNGTDVYWRYRKEAME